jgi:resuscitation-promoting factor RpfB
MTAGVAIAPRVTVRASPAYDYDCRGGTGNGPKCTGRVRVTGPDPYEKDDDGDGVGCDWS